MCNCERLCARCDCKLRPSSPRANMPCPIAPHASQSWPRHSPSLTSSSRIHTPNSNKASSIFDTMPLPNLDSMLPTSCPVGSCSPPSSCPSTLSQHAVHPCPLSRSYPVGRTPVQWLLATKDWKREQERAREREIERDRERERERENVFFMEQIVSSS